MTMVSKKNMVIGVTGSFGCGKSTVARMFKSFGAGIVDADRIARGLIKRNTRIYRKIVDTFGDNILKRNKEIDRAKLADVVFADRKSLGRLNRIIHPQVIRIIKRSIKNKSRRIIILDAPLLIEAGLLYLTDRLVVVKSDRKRQVERLLKKTPLSKCQVLKRIKAQLPLWQKIRLADFVIDNSGKLTMTKKQAREIWAELLLQKKFLRS